MYTDWKQLSKSWFGIQTVTLCLDRNESLGVNINFVKGCGGKPLDSKNLYKIQSLFNDREGALSCMGYPPYDAGQVHAFTLTYSDHDAGARRDQTSAICIS